MGGGAADQGQASVDPRPRPAVLEQRRGPPPHFLRQRHGLPEMAALPIPDEILAEIFLRLPTPADLVRASGACVSFRRVAAARSFVRRFRKLHGPPLLGFLEYRGKVFYPAQPPHPSAPAASAAALAADFSFSFLPAAARNWVVHDTRDGRVLLYRYRFCRGGTNVFPELVVCDPLHRRYLLLPPITYDAVVEDPFWIETMDYTDFFLVSPSDGDEVAAAKETSFRVVWMAMCETRLVAFVFSSNTGQWRAIPSQHWSYLFAGLPVLPPLGPTSRFYRRQYVYGCFYWVIHYSEESKLLVLDTETMEFSIAEPPPEANDSCDLAMVEGGEGRRGMFVLADGTSDLSYFIRKNNGGNSSQWQKVKTISLGSKSNLICNTEKYLLLYQWKSPLVEASGFTLDIETFQLEKVCALGSPIYEVHAYSNFPPSLLSSPTISNAWVACRRRCGDGGVAGEAFGGGGSLLCSRRSGGVPGQICRCGRGRCSPESRRVLPRAGGRGGGAGSSFWGSAASTPVDGDAFA